jgi:hypothetical protein
MNLKYSVQIQDLADQENPWTVYVETLSPDSGLKELPPFDKESRHFSTFFYVSHISLTGNNTAITQPCYSVTYGFIIHGWRSREMSCASIHELSC